MAVSVYMPSSSAEHQPIPLPPFLGSRPTMLPTMPKQGARHPSCVGWKSVWVLDVDSVEAMSC